MPETSPITETIEFLRGRIPRPPRAILVLGSGLGGLADEIEDPVFIPFDQIPGFPRRTQELAGHAGRLVDRSSCRGYGDRAGDVLSIEQHVVIRLIIQRSGVV